MSPFSLLDTQRFPLNPFKCRVYYEGTDLDQLLDFTSTMMRDVSVEQELLGAEPPLAGSIWGGRVSDISELLREASLCPV